MVPGTRTGQSIRPICNVTKLKETAGYDEYGRWCGRTGAVRLPPTRLGAAVDGRVGLLLGRVELDDFLRRDRLRPILTYWLGNSDALEELIE